MKPMRSFARSSASLAAFVALAAISLAAGAQRPQYLKDRASTAPDLAFSEPKTLRFYSRLHNSVFKPDGAGPFPAIVHFHTCGGIDAYRGRYWTEAMLESGYVVLVLDSLGPRGLSTLCDTSPFSDKSGVNIYRGVKDAFDAKAHLEKLPFVDAERVALVGFSWGAMAGILAATDSSSQAFGKPFRAIASFYPGCARPLFQPDIARPLLVLMGDLDNEVNLPGCVDWLDHLKRTSLPVESRMYAGASHSWDTDRFIQKTTNRGIQVQYIPNAEVTRESRRDLFAFLSKHLER
jgi:dienelactone hydrolase